MKTLRITLLILSTFSFIMIGTAHAEQTQTDGLKLQHKALVVNRGYTEEAKNCIECHSQKTPGIVENWKNGKMGHASISCYDCHVVEKDSPMASQCEGLRGTDIYTSPMVSSSTCGRCHPREVEQFLKSSHAELSNKIINDTPWTKRLIYYEEGAQSLGVKPGSATNIVPRNSCQACHGANVELGPDNKPINMTWPGGHSTRYPDGSLGNCGTCHTRHEFSVAEARKPEACGSCHLGPDHPQIEIYEASKHGQLFSVHGEEWNFEAAPETWEPGDYDAPTCAVCHMSGIGELSTTHNINERLTWNLWAPRTEKRTGERGDGLKGDKEMRKACKGCHSSLHSNVAFEIRDETINLYNVYWDKTAEMNKELAEKNLLGKDPLSDGFLQLKQYLYMYAGRRARQGAAMAGADMAQLQGLYTIVKVFKDLEAIYNYRIKNNKIEELSTVMNGGDI
ncbi:multiheme c-type cytochrome [Maridesulfovibrio sp.]|uniref:multiheme c-type cytochrome n=1 Tax=Maridesulfovibrio sp. TaxID=2795000 RepID=UPI002A1876EA|nr:multiheme c-type cytochrome [Maridesulfovibrio sp.]